ncbi:protocadherin Fat 4 isoform X6 [Brienomyrus brachyistius]|uniref:protocadherin Fat 4 isoform X6 n=1 Tax=Brienomyrus brachyistius TaxID=42636 RepID=UPI0020B44E20|nr:protocadherin Fat 4 isoform X6 [Brienomyrus brachyistius]
MAVLNILVACVAVLYIIDGHFVKDWNYSFREQKSLAMDLLHQNASGDKFGASGFGVYRRIKRSALMASSKSVYSFEVREDTAPGAVVGRIETGQPLAYPVLVDDDGGGLFLLNPVSGEFTLARALDYESEQHYILTVGSRSRAAQAARLRVYFNIIDVNDNPPIFSSDSYSAAVAEDASAGACFLILNATDADSGMNAELNWTVAAGNEHGRFAVSHSGALCLEKELDRETVSLYILTIQVSDCGQPLSSRLTGTARVTILVKDVNDNAPSFKSTSMIHIPEDTPLQTEIMVVQAVDLDSGLNGHVLYELENWSGSRFRINSTTGAVYLEEPLDRELVNVYKVRLTARDQGFPQLSTSMNLTVLVEDVNDNDPAFSRSFYNVTVSEDLPRGTSLLQVHAYDADADPNGLLQYYLSQDSPFLLDAVCGVLSLKDKLDRERLPTHILTVFAVDQGVAKRSATAIVQITVTDINDCVPLISPPSVTLHVLENEDFPQIIHQVSAYDEDVGLNTLLLFFIDMGNEDDLFSLSLNGTLQTLQSLDREQRSQYTLHIIAVDSGIPPLTGTGTIQIIVDDINDNPPIFVENFITAVVSEDIPTGSTFSRIHASDIDDGINGEIRYFVENENVPFTIDDLGHMITTAALDREAVNSYRLTVVGRDMHPTHPLNSSVTVSVKVSDVNDQWPRFLNGPYVANIPTTLDRGSIVCAVSAKDEDTGVNAQLTFSLFGRHADWFSIDPFTGIVFTSDEVKVEDDITVGDGGWISKTGELNVTVIVEDMNDNPPVFSTTEYRVLVPENAPLGTTVTQVKASDRDSGANAEITYSLLTGDQDLFVVDSKNGTITTRDMFDFEVHQAFELSVKASNTRTLAHFSVVHVYIQITGLNEFVPKFRKSQYNITVSESMPAGTRLGKVSATDYDLGPDGEVFYLLIGPSKRAMFNIDKHSGEIFIAGDLRKHSHTPVVLQILAKNRGSINGTDIDETLVWVNVLDANDPPKFYFEQYIAEISEDCALGALVTQVQAEDQDSKIEWRHFFYRIERGNTNKSFTIHPVTGDITSNAFLDRERWPVYNLTVTAIDSASPPATGSTHVVVMLQDVNDNAPILFSNEVSVLENQPYGTVVTILNASDADIPPNQGPFTYQLVKPVFGSGFSLTLDGILSTTQPMDCERNPKYSLLVVVQDAGDPPLSSTATVQIRVLDENDNPSAPRNIYIEVKYYGKSFPGGLIGNVQPNDPDEMDVFNCSIKTGPTHMFNFPLGNCDLWSSPYEGEATYNISVEANDYIHPSVNSSIYVNYKGFIDASVNNCVLFYVSSPSFNEFLSFEYLKFIKALDGVFNLQASKSHVFAVKDLGESVLLLAAFKSYNGQYLSGEVASNLSAAQKKVLEARSHVKISHITSNPCLTSPCQNGATCSRSIYISQDFAVLESPTVILVSPRQMEIFNCSCLTGFTGTRCETDIDECNKDLCRHGATCINYPGGFSCQCMRGFTGKHCSSDIDECQSVPCHNGGTCLNIAGTFLCSCQFGFEGDLCEHVVDHCMSSPCLQGRCINVPIGYTCDCPFGTGGEHCEEQSYGFEELSYMEFPALDPKNNVIFFELATVQENSLLLHNHGNNSSSEFLALEIIGGEVQLSYNLGDGVVRLKTQKKLTDGLFHSITARRTGKSASIQVDSCPDDTPIGYCFSQTEGVGSKRYGTVTFCRDRWRAGDHSGKKTGRKASRQPGSGKNEGLIGETRCGKHQTLTNINDRQGKQARSGLKYNRTKQRNQTGLKTIREAHVRSRRAGHDRTLDVGSINMTFGGIKSIEAILLHPAQIRTHDFVGCVRSAKVNGKLLDSSEALTSYNVLEGCPRATTAPCHGGVCLNGGVCLDHWSHHYCQCRELFTGVSCATALTENNAVRLNGQSYIEYIIKESYKREQHLTDLKKGGDTNAAVAVHMSRMEVKFITTEHEGILFSYWGGRGGVILGIKEGKLVYRSSGNVSSHLTEAFVKAELHQARWHVLHLVKDGPTSILYVDSVPVMNTTGPIHDVDRIMLGGGIQPHTENELAGFSGCVEYFKFNGHVLPFDGFSEMVHFRASPTLSHTGCLFQDACSGPNCWEENSSIASCASKACQNGGTCNNTDLGNTSCICLPNFEGKHCELCSSSKHNPPLCAEAHHGTPLWIIGAILPASLVLLSSALLVLLRRLGSKSHTQSMISEKTCRYAEWGGQGMDNKAFHGESGNVLQQTKCIKAGSHPDIIRDELQDNQTLDHVAQSGRETRPVPLQADPRNSEIEYYEVDSFCSIFQSETYTEIVEPVRKNREWPLQTTVQQEFVDRQRQENLSQRHSVGPDSSKSNWGGERPHQGDVICNCIGRGHLHQSDYKLKSSKNSLRKIQTPTVEVLPMGLSVDELRRLTAKLDKQLTAGVGHPECSQPRPEDSSSESVSHSGFTCSVHESERELPFIRLGEQERISESTYSPLNGGAPLAEVKGDVDDRSNETVQHWERLLNLGLHFDTYAHVFEDIAALTMDHKNDSDVQSDGEEII